MTLLRIVATPFDIRRGCHRQQADTNPRHPCLQKAQHLRRGVGNIQDSPILERSPVIDHQMNYSSIQQIGDFNETAQRQGGAGGGQLFGMELFSRGGEVVLPLLPIPGGPSSQHDSLARRRSWLLGKGRESSQPGQQDAEDGETASPCHGLRTQQPGCQRPTPTVTTKRRTLRQQLLACRNYFSSTPSRSRLRLENAAIGEPACAEISPTA